MEKSYENPAMKWVLDGCRRLTLSDTGVVDKIAHNKSGGDVLHRTAKKEMVARDVLALHSSCTSCSCFHL